MPVARGRKGVEQEMHKFGQGKLHSGSKSGPVVTNPKQAIAIALNQAGMSKPPSQRKHKMPSPERTRQMAQLLKGR